jgi:hypothetical protein
VGLSKEFKCGSCGYEALVSGGDDAGMMVSTTTIACEVCKELFDVITFRRRELPEHGEFNLGRVELKCQNSSGHLVRLWTHPGECPSCGNAMLEGEKRILWD